MTAGPIRKNRSMMQANQEFKTGDKIILVEAVYPNGAMVVVGYEQNGTLLAHPLGGGLE